MISEFPSSAKILWSLTSIRWLFPEVHSALNVSQEVLQRQRVGRGVLSFQSLSMAGFRGARPVQAQDVRMLGLTLGCYCLKIRNTFWTRSPVFSLYTGPWKLGGCSCCYELAVTKCKRYFPVSMWTGCKAPLGTCREVSGWVDGGQVLWGTGRVRWWRIHTSN